MISFVRKAAPKVGPVQDALMWEDVYGTGARSRDRPIDQVSALKISAFYRAIDIRSDSIGRLPIKVKDLTTRQEVKDHYLGRMLWERPNEAMTPFVFKKLVEERRLCLGNAYVWICRDRHGRPVEEIPLPPGSCSVYVEPTTGKVWYIAQDPRTHDLWRLDPMDILHYKGFSLDGLTGIGLIQQAARTLQVAQSRDVYEKSVYENGGRPSGVLVTATDLSNKRSETDADGTPVSYKDVIRREWDKIHAGPGNAFRVAVLDNGLDYKPIAMSANDVQFVQSKEVSISDIARFTGVPLYLLFAGKESYQSNQANGTEYVKYTIQPGVTGYEEEDSLKLLTTSERGRGLWLQRNMMAELRGDAKTRGDWYKTMREVGAFSVNDILRLEDEPDVPGGDRRQASLNYVPLEDWPALSRLRAAGKQGGNDNNGDS